MKLYSADNTELMSVSSLERDGNALLIKGRVFGAMPLVARLPPDEARRVFALLSVKLLLFILSLPFRRSRQSRQ